MRGLAQDVRFALRGLRRNPGFTAVAVATLALGIGANSAIFSVVQAVLLRPLPYQEPQRLVAVLQDGRGPVSPANFLDLRAQNSVFQQLAAAQAWQATLTGAGPPEAVRALQLTADLFSVLGVPAARGRTLVAGDDAPGAGRVVVIGHQLWQRRFGGDPGLLGRALLINGESHTVVGIMPPTFQFAPFWIMDTELWVPLDLAARRADRSGASLRLFARRAPQVSLAQAQAQVDTLGRRLAQQFPDDNKGLRLQVVPLHDRAVGQVRRALLVLLGCVSFVLLIACANVANLTLARASARRKEIAVRASLGASRSRLVRQLLTESVVLALAGGALGLLLAAGSIDLLITLAPANLPRLQTVTLDGPVLAFTLAVALGTGLVFGLAPALALTRADPGAGLRQSSRGATEGSRRHGLRSLLVVSQVALALMLLVGAGLLLRSFQRLLAVDAGFDARHVLSAVVPLADPRYQEPARRAAFYQDLVGRVRALPGVEAVGATNHLPIGGDIWGLSYTIEGAPPPAPGDEPSAIYRTIAPGYLRALGMSLLRGRDFHDADRPETPGVAIVNQAFARQAWPGQDPLGKRIRVEDGGPNPRAIVGVVKDTRQRDWTAAPTPEMYLAFLQNPPSRGLTLVVRAAGDPLTLAPALERQVWAIDPNLAVVQVRSMEEVVAQAIGQPRFNLLLLNAFAALALLLAAVGIYGVMAYAVHRRTQELGIRLALGAQTRDLRRLVVGQGMALAAVGVALGLAAAFGTTHIMQAMLFEVTPTDPPTFLAISTLLLTVALLATYLPARRATRIDPLTALRAE
jgi:predicted permease